MELGQLLRQKRQQQGWTQGVAAQKIGIQQSYLSKLENNQFIPSPEVLQKLQQVYDFELPATAYQTPDNRGHRIIPLSVVICFAIALLMIAHFGLLFSHTFYTYEASPLDATNSPITISYELTDEYKGEVYQAQFASQLYQYKLLGAREIPRKENQWLSLGAILLLVLALAFSLAHFAATIKSHK